jgi:hypothetical protein
MKTLSTSLLRHSATVLGYELIGPYPNGGGFDLRDRERVYLTNASRKVIAAFLLESAIARIENAADREAVVEATAPTLELAASA